MRQKKPPPIPSTLPVRGLPSWRRVNTVVPEPARNAIRLVAPVAPGAVLHRPVAPEPTGTWRSQTGAWGRRVTALDAMAMLVDSSPGEAASTVIFPVVLV